MNHKDKRRRRFRRKQHALATANPGKNLGGHADDPPRFGAKTKSRQQLISLCDRLGFDPEPWQIDRLMEMLEQGDTTRDEIIDGLVNERANRIHGDAVEIEVAPNFRLSDEKIEEIAGRLDNIGYDESSPTDHGDQAYANRVPEEEWDDLAAAARRRKRGKKGWIAVFGDAGYELLSDDHDVRERESWVRA